MKNVIPLIVAVVLGLAAVFAVSRTISKDAGKVDKTVDVVAAARLLALNETISDAYIYAKTVSVSSLPKEHILWKNRNAVIGQKVLKPIAKDDYMLLSNIGITQSMGNVIGEGEWGITVNFSNAALVKCLQPGDEIAIAGSFTVKEILKKNMDADATPEVVTRTVTAVIFPRVRVLEILNGSTIILSLPPQQALAILAIQQKAELFPILRRLNDPKSLNRKDGGVFDSSALGNMLEGLDPIRIPSSPTEIK